MTDVKRYDLVYTPNIYGGEWVDIKETPQGEYVRYDNYLAMVKVLQEELQRELFRAEQSR